MTSQTSEFKFLDRGFKKTMVLIPGWATDYRIFKHLDLGYNYLLPLKFKPLTFAKDLLRQLNKSAIEKISLFGWSLGGFLSAEFASNNPDRVDELILLSVQKKFRADLLEDIKVRIKENKKGFLYKLYLNSFSEKDKEGLTWFKEHLLMSYIEGLRLEDLLCGLDYLSVTQINPVSLAKIKRIIIFHGEEDKIASLAEARQIKSELPQAEFILLPDTGHVPFFNRQFKERCSHG